MAKESSDPDGGDRAPWAKGGTTPMHAPTGVGNQKPGQSAQGGSSSISSGMEVDPGPPGVIGYSSGATNKDYAGTRAPGVSAATKGGPNEKWAKGGTTPMFGNRGSLPAKGGSSAQ